VTMYGDMEKCAHCAGRNGPFVDVDLTSNGRTVRSIVLHERCIPAFEQAHKTGRGNGATPPPPPAHPNGHGAVKPVRRMSDAAKSIEPAPDAIKTKSPPGYDVEMDPSTDGKKPPHGSQNNKQPRPLDTFSAAEFEGVEPPPQRWLVQDRVPMCAVTLLAGDGATGKTTIALQLCVCVAGRLSGWLNALIDEHGPVLLFTAEENKDELHRRLRDIVTHHQIQYPPNLHFHCATELDPQLAALNKGRLGQLEPTPVYEALRLKLKTLRPKLVVLESSADLFGGDEINRAQVRLFVSFLRKLARDFDCAVILLSHPSVRGMADDSGTSGNTAWHNSVRARLYFKTVDGSPGLRKLEVKKSNYGPSGEIITLLWAKGVYVPEPQPGSLERQAAEQKNDDLFLTILRRLTRQKRSVSDKPSPSYAPSVFAEEPEAKDTPKAKNEFKKAMTRLLAAERIKVVLVGPPSKQRSTIVEASEVAADQDKGRDNA
jgi:RecA-family ATPase